MSKSPRYSILDSIWGARILQWLEQSPSTNVAWVRISASNPFVVDSLLCSKMFFLRILGFPLSLKTNTSKFPFDLERTDTFQRLLKNSYVLRGRWVNKLLKFYNDNTSSIPRVDRLKYSKDLESRMLSNCKQVKHHAA